MNLPNWCQQHTLEEFLKLVEEPRCQFCVDGEKLVKLKRQWVHYIDHHIYVCKQRNIKSESDNSV